ncbi:hypothetical protein [Streptomyces scabiei]|uniref:hypothetical protein n=1 Tax=Streptomyces scabiei TaxID=1930 RepID=UPI0038F6F8EA
MDGLPPLPAVGIGRGAHEAGAVPGSDGRPPCGHQLADETPAPVARPVRRRRRAASPPQPLTTVLASRAREAQRLAPVGSTRRKAAGVLAVVLDGSQSVEGARRRLRAHRLPPEIWEAVLTLLTGLESGPEESPTDSVVG